MVGALAGPVNAKFAGRSFAVNEESLFLLQLRVLRLGLLETVEPIGPASLVSIMRQRWLNSRRWRTHRVVKPLNPERRIREPIRDHCVRNCLQISREV
jgi:hypothetical protein